MFSSYPFLLIYVKETSTLILFLQVTVTKTCSNMTISIGLVILFFLHLSWFNSNKCLLNTNQCIFWVHLDGYTKVLTIVLDRSNGL